MKQWLKDNPMLVFGLGLPLLLVLLFSVASQLSRVAGVPPKYDVVYLTGYSTNNGSLYVQVVNKHAVVTASEDACYYSVPRMFHYKAASNSTDEIKIALPADLALKSSSNCVQGTTKKTRVIEVPELKDVALDTSEKAPDGYVFGNKDYHSGEPILLTNIFFGGHNNYRDTDGVLVKDGYRFPLPKKSDYYAYPSFLGWVVP
jgi:hypothetical protein